MENNWEPRVGQKVVALVGSNNWHKGDEFEVIAVIKPCKHTMIDIGIKSPIGYHNLLCPVCNHRMRITTSTPWYAYSHLFAPIISDEYPDATAEIANQFKEHPDTVDQPVKVLEVQN